MVAQVVNYSFLPATRHVTLKDVQTVDISRVQYIINTTRGITLYSYSDSSYGTISLVSDNIILLSHSTAGMLYTDDLEITYDFFLASGETTTGVLNSTSSAYETGRIIKASGGTLYSITGYNSLITSQFIMISNTSSIPADGQTPVIVFKVSGSSNFSLDFPNGREFSTGICIFNSTTSPTKTLGAADCFFDAQYI